MTMSGEDLDELKSWARCHHGEFPATCRRILDLVREFEAMRGPASCEAGTAGWTRRQLVSALNDRHRAAGSYRRQADAYRNVLRELSGRFDHLPDVAGTIARYADAACDTADPPSPGG